jgi:hypothetical protein
MQFQIGESVRVRGFSPVYNVIALAGCMVTILIKNPQPDGTAMTFNS